MVTKKMSKGRQKIDIVKMKNENNLQVTFSKRRAGLFKKASELCTLTGSEVAVVVFSPGDKAYSFGSPSVTEIVERYDSQTPHLINPSNLIVETHRRANVLSLNKELGGLENQLEEEKKRGESLSQMLKANPNRNWWEGPFDELHLEQLEQLKLALEELQKNVQIQAQKFFPETANLFPNVLGRNGYGVTPTPPLNIFRPSATSAFFPYDSKPPPILPALPMASYVGPCLNANNTISIKNGPSFDIGTYGSTASVPFDPNTSEFGRVEMPPAAYEFFNKGYGGGSF